MHVIKIACIFITLPIHAASKSLRSLQYVRKEERCMPSEAATEPALEKCGPKTLALKTVQLIKTCAVESTESLAKIYVSKGYKFLKWDNVCADDGCVTVSFCADQVTEIKEKESESDETLNTKSHYSVNVLTYEVARWLFLGQVAIDSEKAPKFEIEDSEKQLSELDCGDWKASLEKPKNGGARSFEVRKKEKQNNYKILVKKLSTMEDLLKVCAEGEEQPPKNDLQESENMQIVQNELQNPLDNQRNDDEQQDVNILEQTVKREGEEEENDQTVQNQQSESEENQIVQNQEETTFGNLFDNEEENEEQQNVIVQNQEDTTFDNEEENEEQQNVNTLQQQQTENTEKTENDVQCDGSFSGNTILEKSCCETYMNCCENGKWKEGITDPDSCVAPQESEA